MADSEWKLKTNISDRAIKESEKKGLSTGRKQNALSSVSETAKCMIYEM